jgi:two-component system nitrate/nitrite sensor histidine kinase NarX
MKGQPIIAEGKSLPLSSLHDESVINEEGVVSYLAVPLERGESNMGMIEVMTREQRHFTSRDAQLLLRLAHQVVIAIENAQLYRKLRYLATLEERDRLAGELHDHLSQGLGYLKVKASITSDLMSSGEIEHAQESLVELKKASQILYTDVREEIFNLRTSATERIDFFSTLQDYLSDYEIYYSLDVDLNVDGGCLANFPPEMANQLLRIIQEALTNVRRHTDAHKVSIQCTQSGEQVHISIEDDGGGFSPHQVAEEAGQHFGLQIMRERAESVGGSLELDSKPGQGTHVLVRVPYMFEEV